MLSDARKLLGLTQTAVSTGTRLSVPTIINVERGFGRYTSAQLIRHFLIEHYKAVGPLDPTEKDRAFRVIMGMNPTEPDGEPTSEQGLSKKPSKTLNRKESPSCTSIATMVAKSHSEGICSAGDSQLGTSGSIATAACTSATPRAATTKNTNTRTSLSSAQEFSRFNGWDEAQRAYTHITTNYSQSGMKALLLAVRSSFQQYATVSDRTIHRALQRNVSVKLRDRSRDENVAELHQALVNVAYPPFAAKRSRAYSKGAYADKAKTSRRTLIDELFSEEPTLNGQIKEVFERFEKELPKDLTSYLERVFRTADGGANPVAEVQQYQNRGLAPRAERVGQMVFLDASTSKCDVENGFGTSSDSGYKRQFFFLCRDVKSRRVFGYMHPAQSEDYGWGGGLPSWDEGTIKTSGNAFEYFLGAMGNAPEVASIDRKSGVATQLLHLHPEKPINVMPGVLLWLAAGVHFHIRQGGRKTGGSYVERDVRTVQDYIEGIEARLAVSKELSGMGFRADRQFDSEAEQRRAFAETIQKVNELLVKCPNGYVMPEGVGLRTRGQIWNDGAAELTNALATDWKQRWYDIIRRARVGIVSKRQVKFGYGRETLRADLEGAVSDLNGPLADYSGEEAISISIPGGILASDTPGLVRVFIIDQRVGKLPRILRAQAHLARVDDAMQPVRRPTAGQFYGLPDREADAATRFRNNAVGAWKDTAAALRTGTTDTPVGTQDVDSRFS